MAEPGDLNPDDLNPDDLNPGDPNPDSPDIILERMLRHVDTRLAGLSNVERDLLRDKADATADDEHDPEGSTLSGEWTRIEMLQRVAAEERREIEAALQRMTDRTYGICAKCGRPIPSARLEVRPTATLCVGCS